MRRFRKQIAACFCTAQSVTAHPQKCHESSVKLQRRTLLMIGVAVCLTLAILPMAWMAPQPAQAQDSPDCWQLFDVVTEWKHFADGNLVSFSPTGLTYSVAAEDLWHFVEYNNLNHPQDHVFARASWTAPPQRFCDGDTVIYQYQVDNFAVSDKTNTLAIITYGPDPIYSSNGFGQTRVGYDEAHSYEQQESVMTRGQLTLDSAYTWRAEADIGDLIAIINYRYLPQAQIESSPTPQRLHHPPSPLTARKPLIHQRPARQILPNMSRAN